MPPIRGDLAKKIFSQKIIGAGRLYAALFTRLENAEILNIRL